MKRTIQISSLLMLVLLVCSCMKNEAHTKLAFIGDSITQGSGTSRGDATSYPAQLKNILDLSKYDVFNAGRSGATMLKESNFSYWDCKECNNVIAYKPDIAFIMLGTNDSKPFNWDAERFEHDYQSMIDTLKMNNSNVELIICTPPPVYQVVAGINDSTVANGVLPIVSKIAEKNKLKVLDMYKMLSGKEELFNDGVHPNDKGAEYVAECIADFLSDNNIQ